MIFTCIFNANAQTYISGYSCYIDDDGEWTEWSEENVQITIDIKAMKITLFDPIWLTDSNYRIITAGKAERDEDNDLVTVYQCKDEKENKWTVHVFDLVTTDPGKLQINFSNDTEGNAYLVMKDEEE